MLVYLCRHAEAAPGEPDDLRELTERGMGQARALAERLAACEPRPVAVICSPLVRARQTAAPIAEALGVAAEADDRLAPGATVASVEEMAFERNAPFVTVGHQPDCSEIALALTGSDPGFPVGSVQEIEIEEGR